MSRLKFVFYDVQGQIVDEIGLRDVSQVDWNQQCYSLTKDKASELRQKDLNNCRIDLILEERIIASIDIQNITSSDLPPGYYVACRRNGEIMIDDGQLCLRKLPGADGDILIDMEYYDFLKNANLIVE